MQYLITYSRPEAAGDVIFGVFVGLVVLDKPVKFHDPTLNRSRQRQYFRLFFHYNFRPKTDNYVISRVAIDNVGVDVPIKFCDTRSNGFREIRGADFVSNKRTLAKLIFC